MDTTQRYWVAGLMEGEGHFGLNRRRTQLLSGERKLYIQPRIECNMTDEDVIQRLAEWTGMGCCAGPYQIRTQGPNRKPYWRYIVNKKREAESLMRELYPLLSSRRQSQIAAVFEALSLPPP